MWSLWKCHWEPSFLAYWDVMRHNYYDTEPVVRILYCSNVIFFPIFTSSFIFTIYRITQHCTMWVWLCIVWKRRRKPQSNREMLDLNYLKFHSICFDSVMLIVHHHRLTEAFLFSHMLVIFHLSVGFVLSCCHVYRLTTATMNICPATYNVCIIARTLIAIQCFSFFFSFFRKGMSLSCL